MSQLHISKARGAALLVLLPNCAAQLKTADGRLLKAASTKELNVLHIEFARMDRNHDKLISRKELLDDIMANYDDSRDDNIRDDNIRAHHQHWEQLVDEAEDWFAKYDSNEDGGVLVQEILETDALERQRLEL